MHTNSVWVCDYLIQTFFPAIGEIGLITLHSCLRELSDGRKETEVQSQEMFLIIIFLEQSPILY